MSYYHSVAELALFGSGSVWVERVVVQVEGVLILAAAAAAAAVGPAVPELRQLNNRTHKSQQITVRLCLKT